MERHFSASASSLTQPTFSSSAIATPMPAHANLFLHFSVSNAFWLCNGGPAPLEFSSHESRFAPPPTTAMAPSFCSSSVTSCSSQKTSPSEVDLPRPPTRSQNFPIRPPIGPDSQRTPTPASSRLTSTTSEGSRPSTLRLRILHPQKKPSEASHSVSSSSPALQPNSISQGGPTNSSTDQVPGFNQLCLGWGGLKRSRSKRRRARTQEAESDSHDQMRTRAPIRRCRSWCSTNGDTIRIKGSSSSTIAESSCITEVSTNNQSSNFKSDPGSSDRVSSNGRTSAGVELTSKLDQLALIACELKGKRTRSPRNQIRRNYTAATFSPLSLITAYWKQKRTSSSQEVATGPHNDSLSLARARDVPNMRLSAKAATPVICNYKDRTGDSLGANLKIKKAKHSRRQTRVQRCAREVLELVGKDIFREKLIRQALGNNPDTSKALRLLLDQRKLGRIGGGGRKDPYEYKVTPYGLLELSDEKKGASSLLRASCAAFSGEGFVENTWNPEEQDFHMSDEHL